MEQQLELFAALAAVQRMDDRTYTPARRWRHTGRDGRRMHDHSLAARDDGQATFGARSLKIYAYLQEHGPHTDREVMNALFPGRDDMNLVRPRISDLVRAKWLTEIGKKRDAVTGMPGRIVAVVKK